MIKFAKHHLGKKFTAALGIGRHDGFPPLESINPVLDFMSDTFANHPPDMITENLNRANRVFVAENDSDGILAACFCIDLEFDNISVGGIGGVCVRADRRRNGLGKKLIAFAISDTTDKQAFLVWTQTEAFFERCGFEYCHHIERTPEDSQPMILWARGRKPVYDYSTVWPRIKF